MNRGIVRLEEVIPPQYLQGLSEPLKRFGRIEHLMTNAQIADIDYGGVRYRGHHVFVEHNDSVKVVARIRVKEDSIGRVRSYTLV